jgi:hypothetical protein
MTSLENFAPFSLIISASNSVVAHHIIQDDAYLGYSGLQEVYKEPHYTTLSFDYSEIARNASL